VRGQLIANAANRLFINYFGYDAVRMELPQMLAQNLAGHSRHASAQIAEAFWFFAEPAKDHGFPAAFNYMDCTVDRTAAALDVAQGFMVHGAKSPSARVLQSA
jgi:hypothetical protein